MFSTSVCTSYSLLKSSARKSQLEADSTERATSFMLRVKVYNLFLAGLKLLHKNQLSFPISFLELWKETDARDKTKLRLPQRSDLSYLQTKVPYLTKDLFDHRRFQDFSEQDS